jgi:hypothetical protein
MHLRQPACVLFALVSATSASASPDRIVIEAYEGGRPPDASELLAPVRKELQSRGFVDGAALVREIDTHVSRAGGTLGAGAVVEAQREVDDAYQRLVDGDYARALAGARAALEVHTSASGQLAREPVLRDLRYKALIIAGRSSEVGGGSEDAFAFMAEAIRSFPDRPVSTTQFDPNVASLYRRVRQELSRQGTGSLSVTVDDPAVTIFVDEQFAGTGSAKRDGLAPGRYRVLVTKGQGPARIHDVEVAPGAASNLEISWEIDRTLRTDDSTVVLALDPGAGAEIEVREASQIARAVGAHNVAVLSVRPVKGRRAISGYSIEVESQTRTFATVQIEPIRPSLFRSSRGSRLSSPAIATPTRPA